MTRTFVALGAISALLAVAAGAFGAHALRARLSPDMQAVFETGCRTLSWRASANSAASRSTCNSSTDRGAHDSIELAVTRQLSRISCSPITMKSAP